MRKLLIILFFIPLTIFGQRDVFGYYSNTFQPWTNGTFVIGNSITVGYLANDNSWADQLATELGITINNLAISSMGVRKETSELFNNLPEATTVQLGAMTGFNNMRITTGTQPHIETVMAAHRAFIAAQFCASVEFPFDGTTGTNPNVSFSHSTAGAPASSEDALLDWGSRSYYFRHNVGNQSAANYWNKSSVTANETITWTSPVCKAIAIGTWGCDGTTTNMSRIKVTVDGVDIVTYDPNDRTYLGQAATEGFDVDGIINDAIVITGLSNISHTVVMTFLDGSIRGAVDWFGALKTPQQCTSIPAYILDLPHMNSTGYNYPGYETTEAILDDCTNQRKTNLQATFPSYPIVFPTINDLYNPLDGAQINSDGIHPTEYGNTKIMQKVLSYMR